MIVLALVFSLPFIAILATRPVLRRLAFRNATRRPRESLLVILGSMLATALMTASFVIGDSLESSFRATAYTQLGPVDQIVAVPAAAADDLSQRMASFESDDVDGVMPILVASAAMATGTGDTAETAAPKAQLLEVDFAEAAGFGGDPSVTGISGDAPAEGTAVVLEPLADKLGVGVGDTFRAFAYGNDVTLTVDRVIPQEGVAGLWFGNEVVSFNAFVPPGTIEALATGAQIEGQPPTFAYLVSNVGGVESGAERSDAVIEQIEAVLGDFPANVSDVKADRLQAAEEGGESLTQLYTLLGSFAVIAGILLLVNIFQMLADERKSELGMLRAMGLKRRSLVAAFASEGWVYAVVASALGTVVGIGVGRLVTAGAARILSSGDDEFRLPIRASVTPESLQAGFTIGLVIALLTVIGSSIAISRFNIIAAIRDLERVKRKGSVAGLVFFALLAVVGVLMALSGISGKNPPALIIGPPIAALAIARILLRSQPPEARSRRPIVAGAAFFSVVWGVAAVSIAAAADMDLEPTAFLTQGITIVLAAVVLVNEFQNEIGHLLARLSRRNLAVRLGLAYPIARKGRTALTLGQFAIVVFILTYISVLSNIFVSQIDSTAAKVSGGYDVRVTSNAANPVTVEELAAQPGVTHVAGMIRIDSADITPPGETEATGWPMTGLDESFLSTDPPELEDRGSYATDEEAYRALVENPDYAMTNAFFLSAGAGPPVAAVKIGDVITVRDPSSGREKDLTIIAEAPDDWAFNGGFMNADAAREIFGDRAVVNRAYVSVDDPATFTRSVEAEWFDRGAQAKTLTAIVEENLTQQTSFFTLMRAFLAVGLVIGVAGIGVIMVRAVRERRRQIGVLRSLGFQAGSVSNAFAIEAAFVAVQGVLIGVVLGLVATWSITLSDSFGEGFEWKVPWLAVIVLVVATLIGSMIATLGPARSASKIKPAVALRITD